MYKTLLVGMLLCALVSSGCSHKRDPYISARKEKETSEKRLGEARKCLDDMKYRAAKYFDLEGAQPSSTETQANLRMAGSTVELYGPPDKPVKDWTDTEDAIKTLREEQLRHKAAQVNMEHESNIKYESETRLQTSNSELSRKLQEVERNYNKIRPFVVYFWWFVLIAIVVSGAAMVFYHGIVTRSIQQVKGTVLAGGYAVAAIAVGLLWYLYGQQLIMYGILVSGILFVVFAISYAIQRERFVKLVTAMEKEVRDQLSPEDKERVDNLLSKSKILPDKAIASVKASLGI